MSRALALAVLRRAIYDAAGVIERRRPIRTSAPRLGGAKRRSQTEAELQREAKAWLTTPSDRLDFWCRMAGISMGTVIDGANGAIARIRERTAADRRRIRRDS